MVGSNSCMSVNSSQSHKSKHYVKRYDRISNLLITPFCYVIDVLLLRLILAGTDWQRSTGLKVLQPGIAPRFSREVSVSTS